MLVLSRQRDESIIIGDNIVITIVDIRGDKDNPMWNGYVCFKGLQAEEFHHGPQRLLRPLKRQPDGSFAEISSEQALDEIGKNSVRPWTIPKKRASIMAKVSQPLN